MRKGKRKRSRRNPPDELAASVVLFGVILAGGVAIWGWKHMTDRDKTNALPSF